MYDLFIYLLLLLQTLITNKNVKGFLMISIFFTSAFTVQVLFTDRRILRMKVRCEE